MPNLHYFLTAWLDQFQSANWPLASCIVLGAYSLGCFTTGYYLVRGRTGGDLRCSGSGSLGAKNAGRVLGWRGFLITLAGDASKGAFAVWAAAHFTGDRRLLALATLSVVAGHIWPVQLRFRGGKGAATLVGALAVYDFRLVIGFLILFVAPCLVLRRSVLPGLFAVALLPVVALFLAPESLTPAAAAEALRIACVTALVLIAHRRNIVEEIALLMERKHLESKQRPRL